MKDGTYVVVLVRSTNYAVRLEQILTRASIPCKMIPVPRRISSDCGVCIRVSQNDFSSVRDLANRAGVSVEGFVNL